MLNLGAKAMLYLFIVPFFFITCKKGTVEQKVDDILTKQVVEVDNSIEKKKNTTIYSDHSEQGQLALIQHQKK